MSAYKSYTPRRPTESTPSSFNDKQEVEKLQELFPKWSYEDLQSVLTETAGDVELAVARISEGHAEQWGSVNRKKEKKNPPPSQSPSSASRGDRDRPSGDNRGGRSGRGGRGRGGGGRGGSRGAHGSFQRDGISSPATAATNGAASSSAYPAGSTSHDSGAVAAASSAVPAKEVIPEKRINGVGVSARDNWAKTASSDSPDPVPTAPAEPAIASSEVTRVTDPPAELTSSVLDVKTSTTMPVQNGRYDVSNVQLKTSKIPADTKLSWAQIARAQEKPQAVAPPPPPQPPAPHTAPASAESSFTEDVLPTQEHGWEEPTTVQPPTWDDEPPSLPPQAPEPPLSTHDGWITADTVPPPATPSEAWNASFTAPRPDASPQESNWTQTQSEEPVSVPSPQVTTPSVTSIAPTASVATSTAPTSKPTTPSVSHATARPTNTHRTSARYPKSDQAVVIPAFAGSIGTVGEKLGMQFGSLSIGSEDTFDGSFKTETEQPTSTTSEPLQQPPQSQTPSHVQPLEAVPPSVSTAPAHSQNFFSQAPQATQTAPTPAQQVQSPAQAQAQATSSAPPFGTLQPPPALTHQPQQPQPQPQQITQQHHQQQQQLSYVQQQQQHSIHAHFDGPSAPQQQQQHQQHQQPQPQHASAPQTASYFRQPETPYYHNATPPQTGPAEHQGAYGAAFSPLGVGAGAHAHAQGLGAQGQGHLGGFGAGGPGEYGYTDGQRGFYDYAQPGSFSNRLVHDESSKAGLPLSQGTQPTSSLSSAAGQPQASNGPQGSSGQPPTSQQSQQQQGYPAPMPYYYPPYYPQNSYPTYPNPSYGQAYMPKYPPVYPHQAPVGPGPGAAAPPPAGKGPSATAPYSTSASQNHLYHGQATFEDPSAGYQHQHQQGTANLGSGEYQKQQQHQHHQQHHQHQQQGQGQQQQPLYGAQATQGLQSFLGIQQAAAAGGASGVGVGGPGQQRGAGAGTGASPEAPYKPYGAPGGGADKTGGGVGLTAQGAGQQGRGATVTVQGGVQGGGGAGTGSFYPGGRFSAGGGGPGQGQQGGQGGYPQSGDQGQFYAYQPRHQGGYWQ